MFFFAIQNHIALAFWAVGISGPRDIFVGNSLIIACYMLEMLFLIRGGSPG